MDALKEAPAPAGMKKIGGIPKLHTLQVIEDQRRFRPHIYWYLSFRCNLACKHCSVFSSPWVDTSEDLSTAECMQVIEQMKELNVGFAILTGGEVLLRPDALEIIKGLTDAGIPVGLETNGLRFDSAFVELARDLQSRNMLQITVSLDGGTAETHETLRGPHSFRRTVAGLRMIALNGVNFQVQCVLNKANLETIPQLYELGAELHPQMSMMQFAFLNPVGRGIELSQDLGLTAADIRRCFELVGEHNHIYKGRTLVKGPPAMVPPQYLSLVFETDGVRKSVSCQFPLLGVLPNGEVTVCAVSRDNEELFFGNVRDISLKNVWQRTRMDMLRSRYIGAEHLEGICGDCVWKYKCKGGCRAWAHQDGESFDAPLPICKKMDEEGNFPKVYRISHQNDAMSRKFQEMNAGCSCH